MIKSTYFIGLFFLTAIAEIIGCYLPYLWLNQNKSVWLLLPAALSLTVFSWLLTLHPDDAGRTYAMYGGIYVVTAILWLWGIERVMPSRWDITGGLVILFGVAIIYFGNK
ncbi:YnfA family protein [Vibrio sp. S4M6]|uniref:YnfA family protein n=1 Tax=Vibrio sinus TaxID=2946865 RepID=UPI00202A12E6|nr:YnfA family protein [Vibrio sinus]MCL9782258.1 YnfA family protein [Vibrio sinus]